MANFKLAYAYTMQNEGGIADDKDDPGGLSYKGITSRDWPAWYGWIFIKPIYKQFGLSKRTNTILANNPQLQDLVQDFYKKYYWDVHQADFLLSDLIATELFDSSVNCGTVTAGEWLQCALNQFIPKTDQLKVDGVIGVKSLLACNSINPKGGVITLIYNAQNKSQEMHYRDLIAKDPKKKKFFNAWMSRVKYIK